VKVLVWISTRKKIPVAMTIAGSDSGGGAGIQADLKTFAAIGVHGTVAITAITAQNTYAVTKVQDIDPEIVKEQIRVVAEDIGIDAAKTGMLHTPEIIRAVAEEVRKYNFPLVVDPVMIAKSGTPLLKPEAMNTLVQEIIPLATVITPNRFEAEKLAGMKISDIEDAKEAAIKISEMGAKAVVVKGGHLETKFSIDILYVDEKFYELKTERISTKNTHGTGCSFSAAIAGYLAKGYDIPTAVKMSKELIYHAIKYGLPIGRGHGPVNPMAMLYRESERYAVIRELWEAYKKLRTLKGLEKYVPETRINFVYSIPEPHGLDDVAGFPGRITVIDGEIVAFTRPEFGASSHVARVVLTANYYDVDIRSAINLKYDEELIEKAKKAGLVVVEFSRKEEPPEVKMREGASLPWGVKKAIESIGRVPDIIYDKGDLGKEPMVRILGKDPFDIVEKIRKILES